MANTIQNYRDQFLMIKECKDTTVKNRQLGRLMTEMENKFNIPGMKDESYNKANSVVMALYQDISNERIF
jgi:hypothetical protein